MIPLSCIRRRRCTVGYCILSSCRWPGRRQSRPNATKRTNSKLTRATVLRHATFRSRQTTGKKAEERRRRKLKKKAAAPAHRAHLKTTLGIHTHTATLPRARRGIFHSTRSTPSRGNPVIVIARCTKEKKGEKNGTCHRSRVKSAAMLAEAAKLPPHLPLLLRLYTRPGSPLAPD